MMLRDGCCPQWCKWRRRCGNGGGVARSGGDVALTW